MRKNPVDAKPLPVSDDFCVREIALLIGILAVGIVARTYALSRSAVEHFDEGVYASNTYFGAPDYAYPQQRFYAPPLLPALIEMAMIVGLPPNLAALLPTYLAGCGTIAAVWWFGRSWFGPESGLAAAALAALSDFHVALSATALTDVLLGLWLLLAVDAIARSLFGAAAKAASGAKSQWTAWGDFRWAVGAGLFTGLAWWTKYNGWLPLAIEAAALVVLWFFLRPPRQQVQAWLACFLVTIAVAVVVWSPYYFSLQSQGGYGPIAANHGRYVVGISGWLGSAARQISNQYAMGAGLSMLGLVLALLLPSLLEPRRFGELLRLIVDSVGGAIVALLLTGLFAVGVGAALGIARMIVAFHQAPRLDAQWQRRMIGLSLVFAWWGGMLVATPFYTPYPRLTLPCVVAAWLAASLNWADSLRPEDHETSPRMGSLWGCLIFTMMVCVLILVLPLFPHSDHLERSIDRRGLMVIAKQIRSSDNNGQPRAIYVLGEPAIYFQLRSAGERIVAPVQAVPVTAAAVRGQPIATFLIAGPHAQRDPAFQRQIDASQDHWELSAEFDYRPSAVVWLDLNDPRRSPQETALLDRVRLYRLRP